jgi:hypothetical protein
MPPLILTATLAYLPRSKIVSAPSCLAFIIGILWSFESAVICFSLYAAFGYWRAWAQSTDGWRRTGVHLSSILSICAATTVALAVFIKLSSGAWPRFDLYFGLVSAYIDQANGISRVWTRDAPYRFFFWAPYVIVLFFIVALEAETFLARIIRPAGSNLQMLKDENDRSIIVKTVAVIGAIQFMYFTGRSFSVTLDSVSLPFAVLALYIFDLSLCEARRLFVRREATSAPAAVGAYLPCIAVAAPFLLAIGLLAGVATAGRPSWLGYIVASSGKLYERFGLILDPNADFRSRPISPRLSDTVGMIERWASDRPAVLVFHPESTSALLWTGKHQRLPITLTEHDQLYEPLSRRIISAAADVKSNDIVIVDKDFFAIQRLDQELLRTISERWAGDLIDTSSTLSVYRLRPKQDDRPGELAVPFEARAAIGTRPLHKDLVFINRHTSLLTHCWHISAADLGSENRITFDLGGALPIDRLWIGACPDSVLPSSLEVSFSDDLQTWHRVAADELVRSPGGFEAKMALSVIARWIQIRFKNPIEGAGSNESEVRIGYVMTN